MKRQRRTPVKHAENEFGDPPMPERVWWLVVVALVTAAVIIALAMVELRR
jgi:hypothetical protein